MDRRFQPIHRKTAAYVYIFSAIVLTGLVYASIRQIDEGSPNYAGNLIVYLSIWGVLATLLVTWTVRLFRIIRICSGGVCLYNTLTKRTKSISWDDVTGLYLNEDFWGKTFWIIARNARVKVNPSTFASNDGTTLKDALESIRSLSGIDRVRVGIPLKDSLMRCRLSRHLFGLSQNLSVTFWRCMAWVSACLFLAGFAWLARYLLKSTEYKASTIFFGVISTIFAYCLIWWSCWARDAREGAGTQSSCGRPRPEEKQGNSE